MHIKASTKLIKLSFILLAVVSLDVQAAFHDSRAGKWEFFLAPQVTNSKSLQGENGTDAIINKASALGFGFGYNVNHHIELSMIFASSSSNYSSTRVIENDPENPLIPNGPKTFTSSIYTSSINFGFTWNLLSTPFTPYITANLGSTYVDSGVPTGEITTGCWYDYWYGYVCYPYVQTYTATELNYGAGVGLRYDFNRRLYMKGGVSQNYLDLNSSNTPVFTTYQFIFGFMF